MPNLSVRCKSWVGVFSLRTFNPTKNYVKVMNTHHLSHSSWMEELEIWVKKYTLGFKKWLFRLNITPFHFLQKKSFFTAFMLVRTTALIRILLFLLAPLQSWLQRASCWKRKSRENKKPPSSSLLVWNSIPKHVISLFSILYILLCFFVCFFVL